jgi:hypothetical protein
MTHRMMNVALMTSNDDIESSSSRTTTTTTMTTTKKRQSGRRKLYTAGISNEKLTCFKVADLMNDNCRWLFFSVANVYVNSMAIMSL